MTLLAPAHGIAGGSLGAAATHHLKLVYWGPGLSGKTTNLKWLHARLRPEARGRLITLDSPGERTIYFDCLPLDLEAGGVRVALRLYTVPGQPRFRLTRRLVLQGVDALVFVWDSRSRRLRDNVRSLLEAREAIGELGLRWDRLPLVVQRNKTDLSPLTPRERSDALLDDLAERGPRLEAVAVEGRGVLETLAAASRAALARWVAAG
jgi:signal recognition particle receptor subunit beta